MGAGELPAGAGVGGEDPVIPIPAPRDVPAWNALLRTNDKDNQLDEHGFFVPIHPVDARVDLALRSVAGAIKCAPEIGTQIRTFAMTPDLKNRCTYEVRRVLRDETSAGNIELVGIDVTTPAPGAVFVEVQYRNLRTDARGDNTARKASVALG